LKFSWCLVFGVWCFSSSAQTPLNDLVFTIGTTIQDQSAQPWSYVLLGSPQANLLAGKKFALYSKSGYPTNAGTYTLRGTIFQQTSAPAINTLLNQSLALGEDLTTLSNILNILLKSVPGITNQTLAQKIATGFQVAAVDPNTSQTLAVVGRLHPGLMLCAGQAFAEPISATTTYEVREVNPGTGSAGDVLGRVTIIPGSPVVLPAPGPPFQVVTNDPTIDNLRIRLRWGTPDALRRLSLLSFGYNVWRIPLTNALASGYDVNPPTLPGQLYGDPHFTRVNQHPATTSRDFSPAGASDPTDPVTVFFTDDNGHSPGTAHFNTNFPPPLGYLTPPFNDGAQFYYFITARDVLGRDGLVSPPGLAQACRRLPPLAPTDARVANTTINTNQPRLLVSWQQNTNAADAVAEYWVYRWPNPSMTWTNDLAPLSNRVGVVTQVANTNLNTFLDNNPDSPAMPGASNFWYTVRAVSHAACVDLLSPHSGPAWGVVRQRAAPAAATGQVLGSCGTPVAMLQTFNLLTNADGPDTVNWNYRFTCQRRDPGIAWVQFVVVDRLNNTTDSLAQIYFSPDDDVAQADYSLPITGSFANYSNDVSCVVGTFYGLTSAPVVAHFTNFVFSTSREEAVFLAGQLLETALNPADPLLLSFNGGLNCMSAINPTPDPSGTVHMTFNWYLGTPMLIQVLVGNTWTSLGVHLPDSNGVYWVSYPACLVGPLPPFQGCVMNLPAGNGDCAQHVARASDDGPVAPIRVQFGLTPRTKEYRVYRSVDGGPLTMMAQGTALYNPLSAQVVRTDDAMPPSASRLCYFAQVLDENGNGSPMSFLGCKEVKPPRMPRPVLAEPQAAGSNAAPQVALTWFCPTSGVYRFQIKIERADNPGSGKPSGFLSSKLTLMPGFNNKARYAGLLSSASKFTVASSLSLRSSRLALAHFDEAQLTPPVGANFGPGPQFTLTASVVPSVPYNISVAPMDAQGNVGDSSQVWKFTWVPPVVLASVPWPARPLPPVKDFDEDVNPATLQPYYPRVEAVLQNDAHFTLDTRSPVGIAIGYMDNVQFNSNAGNTNFASYTVNSTSSRQFFAPQLFPQDFVFRRLSGDPLRKGDPLLPIVVYREQLTNSAFPKVSGNILQVTPMLETFAYSITNTTPPFPTATVTLYDRLVSIVYKFDIQTYRTHNMLCLRDQQPVMFGGRYRYIVARFNDKREITELIPAGEVTIPTDITAPIY